MQKNRRGYRISPRPDALFFSDASESGYGAILRPRTEQAHYFQGHWTEKQGGHMHLLGMFAALWSMTHWLPVLPNIVTMYLDNMEGVYAYRSYYVRGHFELSLELQHSAIDIWFRNVDIVGTYYVPSRNNCEANDLSRLWNYRFDWRLINSVFQKFMAYPGRRGLPVPIIDRFATAANKLLPRYNSLYEDVGSEGNFWLCDPSLCVSWINPPGIYSRS